MFTVPRIVVTILFILCFVLNAISIGLCLSALFLLILTYLDLGHLLGEVNHNRQPLPTFESPISAFDPLSSSIDEENENVTKNMLLGNNESTHNIIESTTHSINLFQLDHSEPLLPESNPDQLNLIFYLLFYLAVAILGIMGAARRYRSKKMTYLACHVLLLGSIICFNLLAWFHFRTYSPLSSTASGEDDPNLLYASLFDFVDFFVGFLLLISLIINRKQNLRSKQRNSITPITQSPNGSSQSYTIA